MGRLKDALRMFGKPEEPTKSSFEGLTEDELEAHLRINHYGNFRLTDAVRPSYDLQVVPEQGYRHDAYVDEESRCRTPALMAAVTRRELFEVFMHLLDPLGKTADVVLETSHEWPSDGHQDLYREHIDMPVLRSILGEYEELLTEDGCTGIAIINPSIPEEVQFDEHKLLIVYGEELARYEKILDAHRVPCRNRIKFITEAEHIHSSSESYLEQFRELRARLGMDDY
ncbi:MAG: hypothetical protein PHE68_04915 [Candidatus Peribacteraceae bacterium]|nr:hypothetical protein [Candidatus Peribacteraceae bacterium]MDD5075074.1 hypothetical protein [Candidatus Peribacteraceae bacterium]